MNYYGGNAASIGNQHQSAVFLKGYAHSIELVAKLAGQSSDVVRTASMSGSERITDGQRNSRLTSLAGVMRRHGFSHDVIETALLSHNAECCVTPLSDDEVQGIAASISRYSPQQVKQRRTANVTNLADVEPEAVEWLWQNFIPAGMLTLLAGNGGEGKSTLAIDLVARITKGGEWPAGSGDAPQGSVLILSCEDPIAQVIVPRLMAAGADKSKVDVLEGVVVTDGDTPREEVFNLSEHIDILDAKLAERPQCKLVIIDPITAYMPDVDAHRNNDVRSVLAPLVRFAEAHEVAVLAISHFSKKTDVSAAHKVIGSVAFVTGPRVVLTVFRDQHDANARTMAITKCNIGTDRLAINFQMKVKDEVSHIEWTSRAFVADVDELTKGSASGRRTRSALERAEKWLSDLLPPATSMPVAEIKKAAEEAGQSWRTVEKAKERLGVDSEKVAFKGHWEWVMPEDTPKDVGESFCGLREDESDGNEDTEGRELTLSGNGLQPSLLPPDDDDEWGEV